MSVSEMTSESRINIDANLEIQVSSLKDSMWRLTNRVFLLENFINKKYGNVLESFCCGSSSTRKQIHSRNSSQSRMHNKKSTNTYICSENESEDDSERIKTEPNDEDIIEDGSDRMDYTDPSFSPGEQNNSSDVESEEEIFDYCDTKNNLTSVNTIPVNSKDAKVVSSARKKQKWSHVKDFPNQKAAEEEVMTNWKYKSTHNSKGRHVTTYCCKHDIDMEICPAMVRLITLSNGDGAVSYSTNNRDHIHFNTDEDGKCFNESTKKVIDTLLAEGVTDHDAVMSAVSAQGIVIEKAHLKRYLDMREKKLGILSSSKRISYTASFKIQVCNVAEKVGNSVAAREFNVNESNVRKWRKSKALLEKLPPRKSCLRHRGAKWPELEKELQQWIETKKHTGEKISFPVVKKQAEELAMYHNIPDFNCSNGWLGGFMKRSGQSFARSRKKEVQKHE